MLSIVPLGRSSVEYLTGETSEDAVLLDDVTKAYWLGGAAKRLGLEGAVLPSDLTALLGGRAPDGRQLVQRQKWQDGRSRQRGWDLTFNAPKSVSVLWAMVGEKERRLIESIHFKAVEGAIGYIERDAAVARRGSGGSRSEHCSLVAAAFPHATSRALEPHLHTHVAVPNLAARQDASWGTLRSRDLYRHQVAASSAYLLELSCGLREAGVPLRRVERWFEVRDVPKQLRERLSSRRRDILAHAPQSAAAAQCVAYMTRQPKRHASSEAMRVVWSSIGDAYGFTRESAAELLRGALRPVAKFSKEWAIDRAVILSAYRLAEQSPCFSKAELVSAVNARLIKRGIPLNQVLQGVEQRLERQFHATIVRDEPGRQVCRTLDSLGAESPVSELLTVERQRESLHLPSHLVGDESGPEWKSATWRLSDQERSVLRAALNDTQAVRVIEGARGESAAEILAASAQLYRRSGAQVITVAPSEAMARALEFDVGGTALSARELIKATGVSHLGNLARTAQGISTEERIRITKNTLVQVASSEQLSARELRELCTAIRGGGATLLLLGEVQLGVSGEPFSALAAATRDIAPSATLDVLERKLEPWQTDAAAQLRVGDSRGALAQYATHGHLHLASSRNIAANDLVQRWGSAVSKKRDVRRTVILAGNRSDALSLNRAAQQELVKRSLIQGRHVGPAKNRFHVGDLVRMRFTSTSSGFRKGDVGFVESIESVPWVGPFDKKVVTVCLDRPSRLGIFSRPHTRIRLAASALPKAIELSYARSFEDAHTPGGYREAFVHCSLSRLERSGALVQALDTADTRTELFTTAGECTRSLRHLAREHEAEQQQERIAQELVQQPNHDQVMRTH